MTHIDRSEKIFFMRIFLTVLILTIGLQSFCKADDIRDFEIEGMSVGDSLLSYFTEKQIFDLLSIFQFCYGLICAYFEFQPVSD